MRISDGSSDVCSSDLPADVDPDQQEDHDREARIDRVVIGGAGDERCERQTAGLQQRTGEHAADQCRARVDARVRHEADRKRVAYGKSVAVRVDSGGRRSYKKNITLTSQSLQT